MSQTVFDTINPATTSGTQLAAILGDFKEALMSGMSGTSRPSELNAGGAWIDTSQEGTPNFIWYYKLYNGTTDVTIFSLNLSSGLITLPGSDSTFSITRISADTTGAILKLIKQRVANSGQVVSGDSVGEQWFVSRTITGTSPTVGKIRAEAQETHTATALGTDIIFEGISTSGSALTEWARLKNARFGIGYSNPQAGLHVRSTTGAKVERLADDAVSARLNLRKARITGTGASQNADGMGLVDFSSTDSVSSEFIASQIEALATEAHTASARGSSLVFRTIKATTATLVDQITITDAVEIKTALTINPLVFAANSVASAATIAALTATKSLVLLTGTTATTLQGVDATGATKALLLHNATNQKLTISNENASATAANRFKLPGSLDIVVPADSSIEFFYSATDSRWKLKSGSGSGGGLVVTSVQTLAASGSISSSTSDLRQMRHVQGTTGQTLASTTPFGTTGGWQDGTEIMLIGNDDTASLVITYNDAAKGAVGDFDTLELTKYSSATFVYSSSLDRWIQK